jgi:adenosylhomocysteinase
MAEAAPVGDVFLTSTGNRDVLTAAHFAVMKDGALLANAGHFDVEIDVPGLHDAAVEVHRHVRPQVDAFALPDGRRLLLLAEGGWPTSRRPRGTRRRSWTSPSPCRR